MDILLRPIITEKMTAQSEKLNRFGFMVSKDANKIQIKKAVESMYNVTVQSVNTMRYSGKTKSRNTKTGIVHGQENAFKKATITLIVGDTIDFYSNI
jgi:large subunit ribosomal protein L23